MLFVFWLSWLSLALMSDAQPRGPRHEPEVAAVLRRRAREMVR